MCRYLVKINGVFYFKRNIPVDLRNLFQNKSILKKSLKTTSLRTAKSHISEYTAKTDHLFTLLSSGYISNDDAQKIIADFYKDFGIKKAHAETPHPHSLLPYDQLVQLVTDLLSNRDESGLASVSIPENTPKTHVFSHNENHQKVNTFEEIVSLFIREKSGKVKPKTIKEYKGIYNVIFRIIDKNTDISTINRAMMIHVRETLTKLPANINLSSEFKNTAIEDLINNKAYKPMSVITADKIISKVSGLFNWCYQNGYISFNPAQGLQISDKRKDCEQRDPFTMDDLERFFTSEIYTAEKYLKTPHSLWIPFIALYTGMRMNEICQLKVDEVYMSEGYYVFDIKDDEKDQQLKNKNARRIIPIHPMLISTGFLNYIDMVKGCGYRNIFYTIKKAENHSYSHSYSRELLPIRTRLGLTKSANNKDFHSFRHTFLTKLKHLMIPETIANQLAGHSGGESISYTRYGKAHPIEQLYEAMAKVEYDFRPKTLEAVRTRFKHLLLIK